MMMSRDRVQGLHNGVLWLYDVTIGPRAVQQASGTSGAMQNVLTRPLLVVSAAFHGLPAHNIVSRERRWITLLQQPSLMITVLTGTP